MQRGQVLGGYMGDTVDIEGRERVWVDVENEGLQRGCENVDEFLCRMDLIGSDRRYGEGGDVRKQLQRSWEPWPALVGVGVEGGLLRD